MNKEQFSAMSLPYGLKYLYPPTGMVSEFDSECYKKIVKYNLTYKCILHPLSDLTKDIEHKGEKFVPIDKIKEYRKISTTNNYWHIDFITSIRNQTISFDLMIMLVEWHFDIAGLIEKGEAIDVNTLEKNPYA